MYVTVVLESMKGTEVGSRFEKEQEEHTVVLPHSEAGRRV